MTELAPGTVFAGHRIDAVVGRGGMGVVYRATHLALELDVALKVIAPELAQDEVFRERFKLESRLAAGIDNPHVIPIRHAGEEGGQLYVTMRFVEGTDLRQMIRREEGLDPGLAVGIVGQVAEGLDAAHAAGLVHRDVKPANILIEARRRGPHAYLTDFGLIRRQDATRDLTRTGAMVGTVDYASPEQIRGARVDARTDVYALGCVLFAALTGDAPYARDSAVATAFAHVEDPIPVPSQCGEGLPTALDPVVARALAKDPEDRYQSAGELGRAAIAAVPEAATGLPAAPITQPMPESAQTPVATPRTTAPLPAATGEAAETAPLRRPKRAARPSGRLLAALGGVAALVAVGAVLALGGGGGGERAAEGGGDGRRASGGAAGPGGEADAAFIDTADRVCTDIERQVESAENRIGNETLDQQVELLQARARIVRAGATRLRAVEAPESRIDDFAAYADTRDEFADALDLLADAKETGTSPAAANDRLQSLFDEKVRLGERMQMEACADRLPGSDRRQVEAVAEEWLTAIDSAEACAGGLVTGEFGGHPSCVESAGIATTASVAAPATGVNGVRATIDMDADGAVYRLQLAYEQEEWRIDGVNPAPD